MGAVTQGPCVLVEPSQLRSSKGNSRHDEARRTGATPQHFERDPQGSSQQLEDSVKSSSRSTVELCTVHHDNPAANPFTSDAVSMEVDVHTILASYRCLHAWHALCRSVT